VVEAGAKKVQARDLWSGRAPMWEEAWNGGSTIEPMGNLESKVVLHRHIPEPGNEKGINLMNMMSQ
jgi:hypothetical protein